MRIRRKEKQGERGGAAGAEGGHEFYVSDGAEKFRAFDNSILPREIPAAQVVDIEKY